MIFKNLKEVSDLKQWQIEFEKKWMKKSFPRIEDLKKIKLQNTPNIQN